MVDAHFAAKPFQRAKSCDAAKSVTRAPSRRPSELYSCLVMTHTILASIRFLSLSAVIVSGLPLCAADEIQVHWNEVCRAAAGNRLTIKTVNGDTVDGYCLSINVDEIAVTTKDQQVVRVARRALSRIDVQRSKNDGHQLSALGRNVQKGLRQGFEWLLSPYAPLGIVAVPATVAWGAVAAPFCLLGDLTHKASRTREIKVI
jgi:hypothetical protein